MAAEAQGYRGPPAMGRASLFEIKVAHGSAVYRYDVSIETPHRNLVRQADKQANARAQLV